MLLNVAGIVIAFATTMLLLSLIVTAIGQAIQAVLRLRGRNLKHGLASAIAGKVFPTPSNAYEIAADILNRCDDAALRRQSHPTSVVAGLLGPRVSWVEPDALKKALDDALTEDPEMLGTGKSKRSADDVVESFKRHDKPLRNRFKLAMRVISLVSAVIVAAVFQISTPDLIKELSVDPARQSEIIEAAKLSLDTAKEMLATAEDDAKAELVTTQMESVRTIAALSQESEALVDITPFRHGSAFYTEFPAAAGHIIGVLMTAILLMLGAPFWYQALETAVKWRDIFSGSSDSSGDGNQDNSS